MTISAELKRIYASAPSDRTYVETLQFSHPGFVATHYIARSHKLWTFELETGDTVTFQRVPFQVVLPKHDDQGRQDMQIAIGNVGRDLMAELEQAVLQPRNPITCIYRVFLDVIGSRPQNDPVTELNILKVDANVQTISATAGRYDVLNKSFPSDIYRTKNFPGLDR